MVRMLFLKTVLFPAAVLGLAISFSSASEDPGVEALESVHRALDTGEIAPPAAAKSYDLIARRYRKSVETASQALFSKGLVYESLGRHDEAVRAYLEVVRRYPGSEWLMPSVDALGELGARILERGRQGIFRNDFRKAGRIFGALEDLELPAERMAPVCYKLGLSAMGAGNYSEAEVELTRVLDDYPVDPWKEKAYYKLGEAYARRARPPSRDQSETVRAINHFESFLARYPESGRREDALERLGGLRRRKAEHIYRIYSFYDRHDIKGGRELYAGILSRDFPDTPWAARVGNEAE